MASLRDIQNKISGVKKTRQITRAMNMVAAAKLRGVQDKTEQFRPYADKFAEVLASLSQGVEADVHPMLAVPEQVNKVGLILLTADRGLCGSFNMNLINQASKAMHNFEAKGQGVEFSVIGRRGVDFFKRKHIEVANALPGAMNVVDFDLALKVAQLGLNSFLAGEVQEVYMIFCRFESMARMIPTMKRLLPIAPETSADEETSRSQVEYLTEPSAEEILVDLLPRYLNVQVYQGLLETSTSEHASRMTAMDNATKNCKDMIENLTLVYNKARQAAVTTELMDIVGGAEAMKAG
jgi:F-type H+-transporting ATPase subunit gamma